VLAACTVWLVRRPVRGAASAPWSPEGPSPWCLSRLERHAHLWIALSRRGPLGRCSSRAASAPEWTARTTEREATGKKVCQSLPLSALRARPLGCRTPSLMASSLRLTGSLCVRKAASAGACLSVEAGGVVGTRQRTRSLLRNKSTRSSISTLLRTSGPPRPRSHSAALRSGLSSDSPAFCPWPPGRTIGPPRALMATASACANRLLPRGLKSVTLAHVTTKTCQVSFALSPVFPRTVRSQPQLRSHQRSQGTPKAFKAPQSQSPCVRHVLWRGARVNVSLTAASDTRVLRCATGSVYPHRPGRRAGARSAGDAWGARVFTAWCPRPWS
jgi:hypothetical protein